MNNGSRILQSLDTTTDNIIIALYYIINVCNNILVNIGKKKRIEYLRLDENVRVMIETIINILVFYIIDR